jgi:hypothetical protein
MPNGELIFDPNYWKRRLREANERHQAIFKCPKDQWEAIENKHREILKRHIMPHDSILDAGCAWGRLLTLLPKEWVGDYLGVDLSPDFIELARKEHPAHIFEIGDLRYLSSGVLVKKVYDWAVLISIRPMIKRHQGEEVWQEIEDRLPTVADKILLLEYDVSDEGYVILSEGL